MIKDFSIKNWRSTSKSEHSKIYCVYGKAKILIHPNIYKTMSKHNNNLMSSSHARCKCGRYATIGEWQIGIGFISYTCPDCQHREHSKPLTSKEYYEQFSRF